MDKKEEFYELLAFCNSSSEAERIKCIVLRERRLKK